MLVGTTISGVQVLIIRY